MMEEIRIPTSHQKCFTRIIRISCKFGEITYFEILRATLWQTIITIHDEVLLSTSSQHPGESRMYRNIEVTVLLLLSYTEHKRRKCLSSDAIEPNGSNWWVRYVFFFFFFFFFCIHFWLHYWPNHVIQMTLTFFWHLPCYVQCCDSSGKHVAFWCQGEKVKV